MLVMTHTPPHFAGLDAIPTIRYFYSCFTFYDAGPALNQHFVSRTLSPDFVRLSVRLNVRLRRVHNAEKRLVDLVIRIWPSTVRCGGWRLLTGKTLEGAPVGHFVSRREAGCC